MNSPPQRALFVPAGLAALLVVTGLAAAEPMAEIRQVRLRANPTGVDVDIESSGSPTWTARKRGEEMLEILLRESRPAADVGDLERAAGLVASVRVEVAEAAATRVTISTRGPVANAIIPAPGLLRVRLRPADRTRLPAAGVAWTVAAEPCLNVRALPQTTARVVTCLAAATPVGVIGSTPGWKSIRTASGTEGWASDGFLHPPGEAPAPPSAEAVALAPPADADPGSLERRIQELEAEFERLRTELADELTRLRTAEPSTDAEPGAKAPATASPLEPLEPIASPEPPTDPERAPEADPPNPEDGGSERPGHGLRARPGPATR